MKRDPSMTATSVQIGLIGDHTPSVVAHRAIPMALQHAAQTNQVSVEFEWVPTEEITSPERLLGFDGLWCVPASPYRSMAGALRGIRHARESATPFLGTCGGFQHAVVEYARHVLGWADADHGETASEAARWVIAPLTCALVEITHPVQLAPNSRLAVAYGGDTATEGYRCRYGLNPEFQAQLLAGPLRATAHDSTGEVRAIELDNHPFFVATLFQPERAALQGRTAPLVNAFVRACTIQAAT
ncbi:CTP synthase [Ideonella sp. B7]|uniref:CTP synthase C-terminal region-related (seleno)protein n=1 Tax=Ideonella benzenivorans TaxID=2831643 RepID=UPI001CEDBEA4|nr:CTP synthase [Ideonella benzenivorans]MCA6216773.1 CTP synthase [Ideonella benzenivorans]